MTTREFSPAPSNNAFITTPSPEYEKGPNFFISNLDDSPRARLEPPPYVRSLTPEQRKAVELSLRRKIDLRLLPMIILMYIMNYLDRNNIATARLAGLQEELNLSSTQYQVRQLL